jgi:hypothetical protein
VAEAAGVAAVPPESGSSGGESSSIPSEPTPKCGSQISRIRAALSGTGSTRSSTMM